MQQRSFSIKGWTVKQLDDSDPDGTFEGLLAVYNNVDEGNDTILPGAFSRTLQNQGNKVPLLWSHDPSSPIGSLTLTDTPQGLAAKGSLLLSLPRASDAYKLLQNGIIKGLSIGWYAFTRASQLRRLRVPKPRVPYGADV